MYLAKKGAEIDYPNFKDTVPLKDHARHQAHRVDFRAMWGLSAPITRGRTVLQCLPDRVAAVTKRTGNLPWLLPATKTSRRIRS